MRLDREECGGFRRDRTHRALERSCYCISTTFIIIIIIRNTQLLAGPPVSQLAARVPGVCLRHLLAISLQCSRLKVDTKFPPDTSSCSEISNRTYKKLNCCVCYVTHAYIHTCLLLYVYICVLVFLPHTHITKCFYMYIYYVFSIFHTHTHTHTCIYYVFSKAATSLKTIKLLTFDVSTRRHCAQKIF